jgi:hypothetical protein
MLTINVIGKNCNIVLDGVLYTVITSESFDLKRLQSYGLKYYYNYNLSKDYFDEFGEHITEQRRDILKTYAELYKLKIKKLIFSQIEIQNNAKTAKDFERKLEKRKLEEEKYNLKRLKDNKVKSFSNFSQLEIRNNEVYLKGLNFILPDDFLKVIQEVENPQPYINFMYNLSSNPNEYVRNNVFTWVNNNQFKITENGYIYGVRWVVKKNDIPELTQFVHSEYIRKKLQKKSPKNYSVYSLEEESDYSIRIYYNIVENSKIATEKFQSTNHTLIGNLYDLFNKEEDLEFTDNYTQTFKIKLGEVVSMNREDCDESSTECSRGLHFISTNHAINNSFGDTLISVLVNPSMIVSIPNDNYPKIRCCEYFPYSILDISTIEEFKTSDLVIDDTDFELINVSKIYDSLSYKTNLYNSSNSKERLQEIKSKLQSFKVKPVEPEQLAVVNRLIKL